MDGTGIYTWPGGSHLVRDLPNLLPWPPPADLRAADLGCGAGVCGRALREAGVKSVAFCDGDPQALALVQSTVPDALTHLHTWGTPIPGGPYDLILGGDILYRSTWQGALLASIAHSLAQDGIALLSDPRTLLEEELPDVAVELGLSWNMERRAQGYTVVRVRRLDAGRDHALDAGRNLDIMPALTTERSSAW